jgi:hypothetical protein
MTGIIHLTACQSVHIYGRWTPLRVLNWKIVAERADLTFGKLWGMGLTEGQLYTLQPDKNIWIRDKSLQLTDITLVPSWKIHVTRDMHATIMEIAMLHLSPVFMHHTGVTFADLVDAGLTVNLMMLLELNLNWWILLGLHRDFLVDMTDIQSITQFQLTKNKVLQCVLEASSKRRSGLGGVGDTSINQVGTSIDHVVTLDQPIS